MQEGLLFIKLVQKVLFFTVIEQKYYYLQKIVQKVIFFTVEEQ